MKLTDNASSRSTLAIKPAGSIIHPYVRSTWRSYAAGLAAISRAKEGESFLARFLLEDKYPRADHRIYCCCCCCCCCPCCFSTSLTPQVVRIPRFFLLRHAFRTSTSQILPTTPLRPPHISITAVAKDSTASGSVDRLRDARLSTLLLPPLLLAIRQTAARHAAGRYRDAIGRTGV